MTEIGNLCLNCGKRRPHCLEHIPLPQHILSASQWIDGANASNNEGLATSQARIQPELLCPLPVVLLGTRAAVKQDIDSTVDDMVYGEQLIISNDFFTTIEGNWITAPMCIVYLRHRMQQVLPVHIQFVLAKTFAVLSFVHSKLPVATYVV